MGAEGANLHACDTALLEQRLDDLRIDTDERVGCQRRAVQLGGTGDVQREQFGPQCIVERSVRVGNDGQVDVRVTERDQCAVDTVERGAGHQADVMRHALDSAARGVTAAMKKARLRGP